MLIATNLVGWRHHVVLQIYLRQRDALASRLPHFSPSHFFTGGIMRATYRPIWSAAAGISFLLLLNACAMNERPDIPANAALASSGNDRLEYTPATDGRVWIVEDVNGQKMIYSAAVAENDSIVVDPSNNQITVNGRVVFDKGLDRDANHKIFFESGEHATANAS
jgi:hypothetical protein